jgi:GNAT superfamily N-acetyltransferase
VAELDYRRAGPEDRPQILELLGASLGWGDDPRFEEFFVWKHEQNPFGPSPAWVAVDGGRVVGFRTFLRWEFTDGDAVRCAVRAVDTATHPDYQGRGIFKTITLLALSELKTEGVDFVFNTPNDQSRPGYLKMGWTEVGRLPLRFRPRSFLAIREIAKARVPASRWPVDAPHLPGEPAVKVLADHRAVRELLAVVPARGGLATRLTPESLAWRYSLESLGYRVALVADDPSSGIVVFRYRQRGPAIEASVLEALAPKGTSPARALRPVLHGGATYAVGLGDTLPRTWGVPLPNQGPILTWRGLTGADGPALGDWSLTLGDVELF